VEQYSAVKHELPACFEFGKNITDDKHLLIAHKTSQQRVPA